MGIFQNLSERIANVFEKMKNKGRLTELEIKQAMREIRIALLEADVNYSVVKSFIQAVSEKALHEEILKSLTPAQQVIKIVNEELTDLMGTKNAKLAVASNPPTIIMMCGLQGAGKTTMCGKLANMLKKQGKNVLLCACDIYRPAAITQLQVVGKKAGVEVFEKGQIAPVKIAKEAIKYANKNAFDTVIVAVARDNLKSPLFSLDERVEMARECFAGVAGVEVEAFSGLLVDYAKKRGATAILRGLRALSDFDYEFQMALMNRKLRSDIQTVFLMSDFRWMYISSTNIKAVASLGGNVGDLVPPPVLVRLRRVYGHPATWPFVPLPGAPAAPRPEPEMSEEESLPKSDLFSRP